MGSRVKEDQLRVSVLLKDTVNLLCKNGLAFKNNMKIVGVLGITLDDDDVFVVHINEAMQNPDAIPDESDSPTKSTGHRTPTKRRRRRSSDSVNTPHSKSARRAAVHIKTDPDDIVVEEIKIHDTDSDEGGQSGDDGLNYAISSIRSLDAPGGTEAAGQYTATSTSQPFITGLVPNKSNIADTGQISDNSSFAWDSNAAQGHAGVSGWSGQGADQTMSQMTQQTMSQGAVQGSSQEGMLQPGSSLGSPGSARIGTVSMVTSSSPASEQQEERDIPILKRESPAFSSPESPSQVSSPKSSGKVSSPDSPVTVPGPSSGTRRPRRAVAMTSWRSKVSLSEKLRLLKEAEQRGVTKTAAKYAIPETTLYTWRRNAHKLAMQEAGTWSSKQQGNLKYGRELDEALVQWVRQQQGKEIVVTRHSVCSVARDLITPSYPEFRAGLGWLKNFIARHSLQLSHVKQPNDTVMEKSPKE